ncbi:MAG: hypothetical protein UHM19_07350 [Bacteroidales bacterium]|jgi:hypothetical protein|nr:hypothetical protein [Bacteroidales bacterium]
MDHKNNPFKVPENYFDNLSNRLEAESKRKHVSVSKVLKCVASISLILALSVSVFVVVFTGDKKEPLLSSNFFSIFSPNKEKEKDNVEKNLAKTSQIEWEKQVENLIAEVEQIQFTEEELDYLESFIDEDLNEYVFNNFENIE